jgi:hypothetical protein
MADGISITEAIATLRRLHEAGYDLAPLLAVAQEHDPDLGATCGELKAVATRYRNKLAAECGAPTLEEFRAAWPAPDTYHPERAATAWDRLGPARRKAAIGGIASYIDERRLAGFKHSTTAAGYLCWLVR